jgi:hypothetical protein
MPPQCETAKRREWPLCSLGQRSSRGLMSVWYGHYQCGAWVREQKLHSGAARSEYLDQSLMLSSDALAQRINSSSHEPMGLGMIRLE